MADPLSIATGILTFIGACKGLASTIQKLHRLRRAPRDIDDLENEISSLQSYIEGINQLVELHSGDGDGTIGRMSLGEHLGTARNKIQNMHQFLDATLLDASSNI